jgi:hypothetical protein
MNYRLVRAMLTALVIICAAAPGSATVVTRSTIPEQVAPLPNASAAPFRGRRLIHTHDARGAVLSISPSGCSSNGALSFIGGGSGSFSGGNAAGILAGLVNEACDPYTAVGAGDRNVIGGDGGSYSAAIVAGLGGSIEGSAGSIIGAGNLNVISYMLPYYNSNLSAIVAGSVNVLMSPVSFIGAGVSNSIVPPGSQIPYGPSSFIGAGYGNSITSDFSVIAGGYQNVLTGEYAAITGGFDNSVSGAYAAILDGEGNSAGGAYSYIGSGQGNSITANGSVGGVTGAAYASIAGGLNNTIEAVVSSGARYGFIGGGHGNALAAFNGVIGGGQSNTAIGDDSTVPGGLSNYAAGVASFAAGNGSQALTNGSFVWSDDSRGATTLKSTAINQFLARAAGGFYLYSSANLKSGVKLAAGSGSWSSLSDRAAKIGIEDVDDARILAKVQALPVSEWSYAAQGTGIRHLGPMAQDFRAAFGLGEDAKHISAVDEEGVALAAIKALQAEVAEKDRKFKDLDAKYTRLDLRLEALERHWSDRKVGRDSRLER